MSVLQTFQKRLLDVTRRNKSVYLKKLSQKKVVDLSQAKSPTAILDDVKRAKTVSLCTKKNNSALFSQLVVLKRDLDYIFHERGLKECYVAHPFVLGKFSDGTAFHAPLILYPVSLVFDRNKSEFLLESTGRPIVNETFLLAYNKYSQEQITAEQLDALSVVEPNDLYEALLKIFKLLDISIAQHSTKEIISFSEINESELNDARVSILPELILGQFNQLQTSLSNDYDNIITHNLQNELLEVLFGEKPSQKSIETTSDESTNFFISQPDYSQEQVCLAAKKSQGLVIHGPPGTGKSQVITNIISDKLAKNEKILVICEKKAALDVVYNRLAAKGLDKYSLLIHDAQQDRNDIFAKIELDLAEYEQETVSDTSDIKQLSQRFESILAEFRVRDEIINKKTEYGYTPYELYTLADSTKLTVQIPSSILKKQTKETLSDYTRLFSSISNIAYVIEKNETVLRKKAPVLSKASVVQAISTIINTSKSLEKKFKTKVFTKDLSYVQKDTDLLAIPSSLTYYQKNKDSILRFMLPKFYSVASTYKKLIREHDLVQLTSRWVDIEQELSTLKKQLDVIKPFVKKGFTHEILYQLYAQKPLTALLSQLTDLSKHVDSYITYQERMKSFSSIEKKLFESCVSSISSTQSWDEVLFNSFYTGWINLIEQKEQTLVSNDYDWYVAKQKEAINLLDEKIGLVPSAINATYTQLHHTFSHQVDEKNPFAYLRREVTKKRNRLTLRQLFDQFESKGLHEMYPCILCSPETASEILSLKQIFDVVIFDEASQMRIERAIPSILRSKSLIVTGDEKQLPPTSFFSTNAEEEYDEYESEEKQLLEDESLLVRAKTVFESKQLNYHYRSASPELIEFSNHSFYHSQLRVLPPKKKHENVLVYNHVKGSWVNQQNKKEAVEVVSLLKKELLKNDGRSFGIITFNTKQKALIEDLLFEELQSTSQFAKRLEEEMKRTQEGEFVGLFVKNIESVQGDERDCIIFSIGYGFDSSKKFRYNFGPLNGVYGPNRLNVAISRAKVQTIVCASFLPSQFKYTGSMEGPKLLGQYLSYVKHVSDGGAYQEFFATEKTDLETKNLLAKRIASDVLSDTLVKNIGSERFMLHFAKRKKNDFVKGYVCESTLGIASKEQHIYQPSLLKNIGWDITFIGAREYWIKQSQLVKELEEK